MPDQPETSPTVPTRGSPPPLPPPPTTQPMPAPPTTGPMPAPAGAPAGEPATAPATAPWLASGYTMVEPPAPAGFPAPAGRRRLLQRWHVAIAIPTAVCAVIAFFAVLLWPTGSTAGPLPFGPFEPVVPITLAAGTEGSLARVDGDRVYLAARRDEQLMAAAASLSDGSVAWEQPVDHIATVFSFLSMSGVVLLFGDASAEPPRAPYVVVALDGDTGEQLWERGYHDNDAWYLEAGVLNLLDNDSGHLRGLDPVTQQQVWVRNILEGRGRVVPFVTDEDLAARSRQRTVELPRRDGRVVLIHGDRRAQVIDTTTEDGAILEEAGNIAHRDDRMLAYGGHLYVASVEDARLYRYDLTALAAQPQILYTAPDQERQVRELIPCGGDQICLLVEVGEEREVVAVHRDGSGVAWEDTVPGANYLMPVGQWLLVGTDEPAVVAYHPDGDQVLNRPGAAVRLDAGNILLFASDLGTSFGNVSVAGYAFESEQRTELGQVGPVRGIGCSWDERRLVCPTETGAGIWRFAGD